MFGATNPQHGTNAQPRLSTQGAAAANRRVFANENPLDFTTGIGLRTEHRHRRLHCRVYARRICLTGVDSIEKTARRKSPHSGLIFESSNKISVDFR